MTRSHIISTILLILVSANMIQGGIIPTPLFQEIFPNLVGIPRFGELTHNFATSAASAASNVFNGFRTYVDKFRNDLGKYITIPPNTILHRFVHGEIWPARNFAGPASGVVPSRFAPGLIGNYGGVRDSGAASAGAASSASGRLAKLKR